MAIEPPTYSVLIVISRFENLNRVYRFTRVYNIGSICPGVANLNTMFKEEERKTFGGNR
jgi:hypothetical protein